ncbi:hypothetical protein F2Q69_00009903 [Brassica cretica]|uniref:Uncharacterized protein n=1 Tax=Brassica cretica TaxID=69181 RepID=A0A8S9NN38_BRACR|nr:hypothetical protein F2Q69_00009903 [Brassica cretica]
MFPPRVEVSDEVFCCTWCCDVGAGVTCCRVVRCGVVINLYAGVGVLVGIRALVSDEVFCCTWCCDVGAGVTCCRVVRCGVVINLYAGVGVLVGIRALGSDVLGDVLG